MTSFSNLPLDARIRKEVATLVQAGHEIILIGYTKQSKRKEIYSTPGFLQISYPFYQVSSNSRIERLKRLTSMISLGCRIFCRTLLAASDIYHSHEAYPLPACFLAAKLRGKKLVYDAHELYEVNGWFGPQTLEKLFISSTAAVINVNEARAEVLAQRYGLRRQWIIMNCPPRKPPSRSTRLRETLGIGSNALVVIYHGGFYPRERALDELIRAACLLPQNVHIVILGFDSKGVRKSLEKMVSDLQLSDRVHILDPIPPDHLVEFSTDADIGIIPQVLVSDNQRYANPNKLFEYMASGLAVVATDTPTVTHIISEYGVGEVFERATAEAISNAILRFLEDPDYLQHCKNASRRAAEEVFFWEKEEMKLMELYSTLQRASKSN